MEERTVNVVVLLLFERHELSGLRIDVTCNVYNVLVSLNCDKFSNHVSHFLFFPFSPFFFLFFFIHSLCLDLCSFWGRKDLLTLIIFSRSSNCDKLIALSTL